MCRIVLNLSQASSTDDHSSHCIPQYAMRAAIAPAVTGKRRRAGPDPGLLPVKSHLVTGSKWLGPAVSPRMDGPGPGGGPAVGARMDGPGPEG